MKKTIVTVVLGLALLPSAAFAATPTKTEKIQSQISVLMERIRALEQRISVLEGKKTTGTAAVIAPASELEESICKTNGKFDKNNKVRKECKKYLKK